MIAQLLTMLLGEAVFDWALSTGRSFEAEVARYMERREPGPATEVKKPTAR